MNVVLYSRVSSERQDVDLSISAQSKQLREYANKHGHLVLNECRSSRDGTNGGQTSVPADDC